MRRPRVLAALALPTVLSLSGCTAWLFSGENWVDRTRPVALVETTGGVELGATTEFGVLTLGRTATTGPCRVHYFLGPTPLVETGELLAASPVFTRADIDLKTQLVRAIDRPLTAADTLQVMWTADGERTHAVSVRLASATGMHGEALADPGQALPTGATLLCRVFDGSWQFAGLIAGTATVTGTPAADGKYYVIAGMDRVREMIAIPTRPPLDMDTKYRTDDITVRRPAKAATPDEKRN